MDDVDLAAKAGGKGWWEEPDPKTAHREVSRACTPARRTGRSWPSPSGLMKRVDWKGKSVLEYGCGGGYFTVWMAKQGAQVTAIEMSPCAIGAVNYYAAQEGVADRVRVVPGNAETDTVDGQYDFIFAKDLVEHLEDDGPFFRRLAQQLKPGGRHLHRDPERSLAQLPAGRRLRAHLPSQQALVRLGPDSQALLQCAHARRRACGRWASRPSPGDRAISSRGASSANG